MRYLLKKIYENGSVDVSEYVLLEEAVAVMSGMENFEGLGMVALLDTELNTIVRILHIEDGSQRVSFWDGDMVKLRKEYCGTSEDKYIYRVTDINENTRRCLITCENSGLPVSCSECVGIEMIEPVG